MIDLQTTHTPGPWTWRSMGGPKLTTQHYGALIVMSFAPYGMHGGQPCFAKRDEPYTGGFLHTAQELGDINRHPDAKLIAAAPQMRDALETVLSWMTNANAVDQSEVAAAVFTALRASGFPAEQLDDAATCLIGAGAANPVTLSETPS